jgi:PhnB protein
MHVQPSLFFNGCCEAAVAFYPQTLGAEVTMRMRFKDSPEPPPHRVRSRPVARTR